MGLDPDPDCSATATLPERDAADSADRQGLGENGAVIAIFVYGSLQHDPLLERLLGRVPESEPARLVGHRAAPLTGRVYPGLLVDVDSIAPGRLILVTPEEAVILDQFESDEYERVPVTVTTESGAEAPAEAWLLIGPSQRLAEVGAWDYDHFLTEHVHMFLTGSSAGDPHPGAGS